ncbi:ATP-binding cassette domain-containing protein [Ruegeria profundi]|uniref:ATP-binding cassette domain-containing protein n=1 Tax=Ruegeria profundi TaxID=1685378 RepID=UPI001CD536A9|nr:ATP-binding cassette domain-containing protein [Ruegeria profundi]MCA0927642.1 ATP-binding cassette domain-containing protein [Ruegeria profundi]
MNTLLQTKNLTKSFGGVVALDNVDFSIKPKELRCIIGPNGAGKSTFFRCLTGQHIPTTGNVFFKGREITGRQMHEISGCGIGTKTQVPNLFDDMTVYENLWLSASSNASRNEAQDRISEAARLTRTESLLDEFPKNLAHGLRQRAELAMVISAAPDLVLLDEPAAGLTHAETRQLAKIIQAVNEKSAVVIVEHDMQFVREIADKITVLCQGAILIEGSAETVLSDTRVREVYLGRKAA